MAQSAVQEAPPMRGATMPKNVAQSEKLAQRNADIKEMHKAGWRQVDIAKRFKVTQARVSQIVRNPNADRYYT